MTRRTAILLFFGTSLAAGQETAESLYAQAEGKAPREAIALLRKSIQVRPTFEAHYRLGVTYLKVSEFGRALDSLRNAYVLTSPQQAVDRAHIFYRRAQVKEGLGELQAAYAYAEQSLALEDHPVVRKKLHDLQDALAGQPVNAKGLEEAFSATKDIDIRPVGAKPPSIPLWVNFDLNKHTMTSAGMQQAEVLANEMLSPRNSGYKFLLVGHTDKSGSDAINDPLSVRRAAEVCAFLVSKGLEATRARAEGRGSREPLREGNSEADHRVNRRVELILSK